MTRALKSLLTLLRKGDWLDTKRLMAWSSILLVFEVAIFLFFVAGTHGYIVNLETPTSTDFVSFYAAGTLTSSGSPELVYSQPHHYAAEQEATEPGIGYNFFFYPPVFLLLCSLLARLPYLLSFVVFETTGCLLYLSVTRQILGENGWRWLVPVMAFPAVFWVIGIGQNSFLTATFFGAATALLDRRPILAGVAFGLICYKPHFGLLVPVALAAGQYWKTFLTTAATVAVLAAVSALAFGLHTWWGFFATFAGSRAVFSEGQVPFSGLVSMFAAARMLGIPAGSAYLIQAMVTLVAAVAVGLIWYLRSDAPVRFAALISGTMLAIPVVLIYDLLLLAVAGCWLIRAGRDSGFLNWEKTLLVGLFLVPLLSRSLGIGLNVPVGPLGPLVMLCLCAVRTLTSVSQMAHGTSKLPAVAG